MRKRFDVVVVGGGPSGAISSYLLTQQGLNVCLLERRQSNNSFSRWPKVDTLPPKSVRLLENIGLKEVLIKAGSQECPGVVSFWDGQKVESDHLLSPDGLGWHVNRYHFDHQLIARLRQTNAVVLSGAMAKDVVRSETGFDVLLDEEGHNCVSTRYLIDATGMFSNLANKLGFEKTFEIKRVAARTIVNLTGQASDHRLYVEQTENGWWYSVPYDKQRLQVTFVSRPSFFSENSNWKRRLNDESRMLRCLPPRDFYNAFDNLRSAPAHSGILRNLVSKGFIAVGDAAFSIDPLSGQGLYHAIKSALDATRSITSDNCGVENAFRVFENSIRIRYKELMKIWSTFNKNRARY